MKGVATAVGAWLLVVGKVAAQGGECASDCFDSTSYTGPFGGCAGATPGCDACACALVAGAEACALSCENCPSPTPIVPPEPPAGGVALDFCHDDDDICIFSYLDEGVTVSGFEFTVLCDDSPVFMAPKPGEGSAQEAGFLLETIQAGLLSGFSFSGQTIPDGGDPLLVKVTSDIFSECQSICIYFPIFMGGDGMESLPVESPMCIFGILPPSPPSPPAVIIGDPHFVGFNGQQYDVTGVNGRMYNLMSDWDGDMNGLSVNAMFSTAYTTGLHISKEATSALVRKFRQQGTWMSMIGIVSSDAASPSERFTVSISTEDNSYADVCALKPKDCFQGGTVIVNGVENVFVGDIKLGSESSLTIKNRKSFGRLSLTSSRIAVDVDYIPAPAEWEIGETEDKGQYAHLNMKINMVILSETANGILGCTMRIQNDVDGQPIMKAYDKDGLGVLEAPVTQYEVPDILFDQFPEYSNTWAANAHLEAKLR